jgi:hypothetical protein
LPPRCRATSRGGGDPGRVFEAGSYRALRERGLEPAEAEIAAIASLLDEPSVPDPEPAGEFSKQEQIVERVASAASDDDGYRVQLIDLAASHGGIYREALDRVYELQREALGRCEAMARLLLDYRQLVETQKRDRAAAEDVPAAANTSI